jgi:RsmE family RNA methyltransferase
MVVAIGPEGGFADDEIPPGVLRVGLGERVLRVETAAIAVAAFLRLG